MLNAIHRHSSTMPNYPGNARRPAVAVSTRLSRLCRGSAPPDIIEASLDVIAHAFVSQPSTAAYLQDPTAAGLPFWRMMAQEILEHLPPASTSLYVLQQQQQGQEQQGQGHAHSPPQQPGAVAQCSCPSAAEEAGEAGAVEAGMVPLAAHAGAGPAGQGSLRRGPLPEAVAVCYRWRPGLEFKLPQTEAFLHPAAMRIWNESGDLWNLMFNQTYDRYGEFFNIDFLGVPPELAGNGRGRAVLQAILEDADAAGSAVFLAACGKANRDWYSRYGFTVLQEYCGTTPGLPGHVDLTFMVRPPPAE